MKIKCQIGLEATGKIIVRPIPIDNKNINILLYRGLEHVKSEKSKPPDAYLQVALSASSGVVLAI